MVIVVDASVAVKWIIPETDSVRADEILVAGERLMAPSVIVIEVAAALAKQTHLSRFTADEARILLDQFSTTLTTAKVELYTMEPLAPNALAISAQTRHPLVDCLYIALAQARNARLATADRKLASAAEQTLGKDRVIQL